MRFYIVIASILFISSCKQQQTVIGKFNLGFELLNTSQNFPKGWDETGNCNIKIDKSITYHGQVAIQISSNVEQNSLGGMTYEIPAKYDGELIKLEGYIKTRGVQSGFAGLLLGIKSNNKFIAYDNKKIVGTNDWKKYSIELEYPENADSIYIGGLLQGEGQAWFDNFVLTIDNKNLESMNEIDKSKHVFKAKLDKTFDSGSNIDLSSLSQQKILDLELLGKVWGFLKYYHPSISSGDYNWDYELFKILPSYIKSKSINERERILLKWIKQLGKIPSCTNCQPTAIDAFLKPDLFWIENQSKKLKEVLSNIYANRNQANHYYIRKNFGVGNPLFLNEASYKNMPYPDDGFRLLSIYRYWNIIQYYFPYKHLLDKDWNKQLQSYIPKFINAKNEFEYELIALQIIAEINDTHANLWQGNDKINSRRGNNFPPVHVQFVEDKLVVMDYYDFKYKDIAELNIGDVITHINKKPVSYLVDSLSSFYPASNKAVRLRDMATDLLRSTNYNIPIKYESNGVRKDIKMRLYERNSLNMYKWYKREYKKSFKLLENNIGYITLATINDEDIPVIKDEFKNTKGIIIDIRNYPASFVPFSLGSFFVSSPTPFVKFTQPNFSNPGEFTFSEALKIPPSSTSYEGKLIIIVNEFTQSQAEYTAMAFDAGINTTIIGSMTAGADGNISTIFLPGGLKTYISGIGVYYPDGRETQRIGIVPDIIIKPTIEGIRQGRDELMEVAIEIISNNRE